MYYIDHMDVILESLKILILTILFAKKNQEKGRKREKKYNRERNK